MILAVRASAYVKAARSVHRSLAFAALALLLVQVMPDASTPYRAGSVVLDKYEEALDKLGQDGYLGEQLGESVSWLVGNDMYYGGRHLPMNEAPFDLQFGAVRILGAASLRDTLMTLPLKAARDLLRRPLFRVHVSRPIPDSLRVLLLPALVKQTDWRQRSAHKTLDSLGRRMGLPGLNNPRRLGIGGLGSGEGSTEEHFEVMPVRRDHIDMTVNTGLTLESTPFYLRERESREWVVSDRILPREEAARQRGLKWYDTQTALEVIWYEIQSRVLASGDSTAIAKLPNDAQKRLLRPPYWKYLITQRLVGSETTAVAFEVWRAGGTHEFLGYCASDIDTLLLPSAEMLLAVPAGVVPGDLRPLVARSRDDEGAPLGGVWPEIESMDVQAATAFLRRKTDEGEGVVSIAGVKVPRRYFAVVGPLIMVSLMVLLFVHVQRLEVAKIHWSHAWVYLYSDWLSSAINVAVLAILPIVACVVTATYERGVWLAIVLAETCFCLIMVVALLSQRSRVCFPGVQNEPKGK